MNTKNENISAREALKNVYENTTFGEFVKAMRECDEVSQTDLAKKLKVSRQFINAVEMGKSMISIQMSIRIATALGYPHETFVKFYLNDMLKKAGINKTVELKEKNVA
ncbi:helix-turn-helix transcriptional regulator [Fluviispira sanaruensis]|uniref:XRE family transcriptional regulator n=1 Tax=Fluviispira sanaruensis TaxID=2493639 RepID=A0A4P2VK15_FLUSA|nr:helix-turn-helix transcriptional regulator [Fluviispira sanaruensis]BBH53091.1 XRE family transcriptional regulator [Fluviispira sanaruensis]